MKAFFLTAATILACAGSMFAQNLPPDYRWEVGVNAGLSTFTRPVGPAGAYQGRSTNISNDYSLRANYFLNDHWMLSADVGTRQWIAYGQWQQTDLYGQALKPTDITFLVADKAITESIGINYVIPFSTRYNTFIRSNINFGITVGMINTVNDNSIAYSKYKDAPDPNYTYVSKYDYGYGIGTTWGLQIGYTYYIIPRLALNLDLSMRYADVHTNDERYAHSVANFHTLYFPETIGLRFRF